MLSGERRGWIMLGVYGLAGAVLLGALYAPAVARHHRVRAELQELRSRLLEADLVLPTLESRERTLVAAREQQRRLLVRAGSQRALSTAFAAMKAEAEQHGVQLQAQDFGGDLERARLLTSVPDLLLREVPVTVTLSGHYRAIAEFLGSWTAAPFLVSMRHLEMAPPERRGADLRAEVELSLYVAAGEPSE